MVYILGGLIYWVGGQALTLYWLSSSLYSLVQNIVLHFAYPMPKAVTPCKPKSLIGYEAQKTPSISPK